MINLYKLNQLFPDVNIKFKNESLFMKILGKILFFNPDFMTKFTTTIGNTIYFPSKNYLDTHYYSVLVILCHELVHVKDYKKFSILFPFLYLFPISLIPFLCILFFFLNWYIVLGLIVLCLLPLPAPGRTYFEAKAYTMSLFVHNEISIQKGIPFQGRLTALKNIANTYNKQFTGPNYYFSWPFGLSNYFLLKIKQILSKEIEQKDKIYTEILNLLK